MASYLRPRRGKKATATSQAITLKRGEVFFEVPTGGVGTGIGKIKMGDGSTTYSSLPYFASTEDDKVAFTNVTATTASSNNTTYLSDFAPTATLKVNFNKIKQLLFNLNGQVTSLNNDFVSFQSGVSTIVAAINAKAGSSHAATAAPSAIAATVNNLNLGITPSGTIEKSYTTNKTETFDVTSKASCKVTVNVPASAVCSGSINITSNGSHTVTGKVTANVNVPVPSGYRNCVVGSVNVTGAQTYTVNCGFTPTHILISDKVNSPGSRSAYIIDGTFVGSGNSNGIREITTTSTGFTFQKVGALQNNTYYYFACK